MTVLIYTSWPDEKSALKAAQILVGEHLAACVNILPPARSVYRWEGEVCTEGEIIMFIKTAAVRVKELKARFLTLHPYEVPAFTVLPVDAKLSHYPYMDWVKQETRR